MKRNLMRLMTVAGIGAGLALAQAPANPQAPAQQAPMHRQFRGHSRQKMAEKLNLTDAQKAQAKAIFQATRQQTEPIRTELRQNRKALSEAVKSDNKVQIEKLSRSQGELMGRLMTARNESRAKFYSILTPAQKGKLEQLHSAFRQRMEQRRAARG